MTELEYNEFLKSETDLEREANLYFLEHHGVKNQKWGVKNGPPYPVSRGKDGKPTEKQKKKKQSLLSKLRKKKEDKASAKKTKEEKKEESQEEIRKKTLASSDPAYVYKNRHLLTDAELQDRINRINKEMQIKNFIQKPDSEAKRKIKNAEEFLKSSASMADSIGKVYNVGYAIAKGEVYGSGGGQKKKKENRNN